jgi:hypothetical protein
LPSVAKVGTTVDVNTLFPSPIPAVVSIPSSSSSSSLLSEEDNYKKRWCENCKTAHKLDKNGHKKCPEWKVGLDCEEEPGYYDRDD